MIDKAWRAVTPLTIHNCFKKSGFPSPNLVDMDNTLTEFKAEPSLWEALPEQDLTFEDYMLVDTDIAVWGALSDTEIVALDHNNTESDEDESEELTPATLSEAKVSLNKLRNFFLQNHVDADILQASFVLEKSIDKKFKKVGITFQDGSRFNSCQEIYSQFGLAIHQNDHQARHRFVEWARNEIAIVPDFHKQILFSDEAHFWLNGYVNKQNCRIWSEANPQVYGETLLHPEKLTVWCALWAGGIIGPYFFKNDEGHTVTVNGDWYRAMITNFFIPELNNHDVQELWFQQDGATCHTARATIDLLKDTFGDRLISRFVPVNWPPRSCDLTPLDYFLWDYVKSLAYVDKPQMLDHLEDICRVTADIRPQMLEKVIENWTSRLDYIRASRGSQMPEIIFKM
ncbi:putative DD41D transposase [Trichonephila clavipes]|nr:putative DD41D transposase [Trichonephila clavipes]